MALNIIFPSYECLKNQNGIFSGNCKHEGRKNKNAYLPTCAPSHLEPPTYWNTNIDQCSLYPTHEIITDQHAMIIQ